ncbi:hypothetical protein MSPP1_003858 [Malassezia sp. CBS 17886]|nr:hypothetical protein MSPP1_003858 [Malassezia sp. CBS 17886]
MAAPGSVQLPFSDALPYYDTQIDMAGMRDAVQREIAAEKADIPFVPDELLAPAYEPAAENEMLAAELARAERGEKLAVLDTMRHQVPAPEHGLDAPEDAWDAALRNAASQLVHMDVRHKNLDLLRHYGPNLWRLHNYNLESFLAQASAVAEATAEETDAVNRARKTRQMHAGEKLSKYEARWAALVSKSISLRVANLTAQAEAAEYTQNAAALREELARME